MPEGHPSREYHRLHCPCQRQREDWEWYGQAARAILAVASLLHRARRPHPRAVYRHRAHSRVWWVSMDTGTADGERDLLLTCRRSPARDRPTLRRTPTSISPMRSLAVVTTRRPAIHEWAGRDSAVHRHQRALRADRRPRRRPSAGVCRVYFIVRDVDYHDAQPVLLSDILHAFGGIFRVRTHSITTRKIITNPYQERLILMLQISPRVQSIRLPTLRTVPVQQSSHYRTRNQHSPRPGVPSSPAPNPSIVV